MKKLSYTLFMLAGMAALTTISSCKKNTDLLLTDTETVNDNLQLDEAISDTFTEITSLSSQEITLNDVPGADQSVVTNSLSSNTSGTLSNSCRTVTISPLGDSWPKTVTIDFGNGCDDGGKIRTGKIIAVYSGRLKQAGSSITVTFENFSINGNSITGTKTIVNNGLNGSGNYTFTITVSHTRTSATGTVFTLNSTKTIEWKEGISTSTPFDDVFSFTGSDSGIDAKGRAFSTLIIEPLVRKVACRFFVSGSIQINVGDRPQMLLDYGTGECDALATLTVNGVSKQISLRK
ncbi:MAG: hypothetical protein ACKOW2_07165 [Sphingobacteriaceae bacterium]